MNAHTVNTRFRTRDTSSTASSYKVTSRSSVDEAGEIKRAVITTKSWAPVFNDDAVETAVYGYIRAIRALGRRDVNTTEIAKALSIPLKQVEIAAARLKNRGVKAR